MPTAATLLREVQLFKLLDADERDTLAAQLDELDFKKGERIYSAGDPGGAIFVVQHGVVRLSIESSTGEIIVIDTFEQGSVFGEFSLLDGDPRSADAITLEDTKVLRVDRSDLRLLFEKHPEAALDLLTVTGRRLRETDKLLRTRGSTSPNQEVVERATTVQRISDALASFSGTLPFLGVHLVWFTGWILVNTGCIPRVAAFDPFPFGLLTMVVSLEAIFLSCFVLISQNRQAAKDRIRSDVEYAANIRAGLEVTQLHVKMDRLNEQLLARMSSLDRRSEPRRRRSGTEACTVFRHPVRRLMSEDLRKRLALSSSTAGAADGPRVQCRPVDALAGRIASSVGRCALR